MKIRLSLFVAAGWLLAQGTAIAASCQDDVGKIDAALAVQELAADVRAQVEDMRNQAVQLCGAGNEDEGLAVTSEAKALLKLE
jgi:hypothetical protein